MRENTTIEGALSAKHQVATKSKWKNKKNETNGNTTSAESTAGKGKKDGQMKSYPPCQHYNKKGHPPFKCWRRSDAKCSKCQQMGHEAIICKNKMNQNEEEARVVDQEEEDHLFVATCFTRMDSTSCWLIDSGCSNHMTHNKSLFKEWCEITSSKVRVGDGKHIAVKGKGTISIPTCHGTKLITDVLYVPDINQNLLSVGELVEKGYKVLFKNYYCLIKDGNGSDLFRIRMKGKSFVLNPLEEEQIVFLVNENTIDLWHKRLGHYHHQGLLQMKAKELVSGLPNFDDRLPHCKACQLGKKIRKPFPKSKWRATKMLQLMHTDVVGPQRTTVSLSGSLYYVIFIDDFTRMCWIFFMKHKSKVAQIF